MGRPANGGRRRDDLTLARVHNVDILAMCDTKSKLLQKRFCLNDEGLS